MKFKIAPLHFLAALIALEGFWLLLRLLGEPGVWAYDLMHRTRLQWLTVSIFIFSISALFGRMASVGRERRALSALKGGARFAAPEKGTVASRLGALRADAATLSPAEIRERDWLRGEEDQSVAVGVYSAFGDLVQLMLGVGFLGTVLGLSQSFAASFGNVSGDADALVDSIGCFAGGLSTALDTTLLGLGCALVVSLVAVLARWMEEAMLADVSDYTRALVDPERSEAAGSVARAVLGVSDVRTESAPDQAACSEASPPKGSNGLRKFRPLWKTALGQSDALGR